MHNVRKKLSLPIQWVVAEVKRAPVLRNSPADLASAFAAHIAWVSAFGKHALYRGHNNPTGIPWDKAYAARYGASPGFPDNDGVLTRFPGLDDFVDCYLQMYAHLLNLNARAFFAHMQKNDITPNARRRWAKIVELWETDAFAE